MKYRLLIQAGSMRFTPGLAKDERERGYLFEDEDVNYGIAPKRKVLEEADLFESNLNLSVGTLPFGDIKPNSLIGKHVQKVFSITRCLKDYKVR